MASLNKASIVLLYLSKIIDVEIKFVIFIKVNNISNMIKEFLSKG